MVRRAPLLFFTAFFAACAPGACQRSLEVEICASAAPDGPCTLPPGGFAAGLGYGVRATGEGLPREVELVMIELPGDGDAREIARAPVEVPAGAERLDRRVLFPTVGRYRIEVRAKGGALLGRRDVEVTVPTVRPGAPAAEE